jgi:uncharacterized delta-60 repeat protein
MNQPYIGASAKLFAPWLALALACGDDDATGTPDAGPATNDSGIRSDGGGAMDAGANDAGLPPDAGPLPEAFTLHPTPLVATATDRLLGVAIAADGSIFATGFVQDTLTGADSAIVVVKFDAAGALVADFGEGGVARHNIVEGGTQESARGIVVQASGRVVVAGHAEHDPAAAGVFANDRDIFVLGIDPDTGALDDTFGEEGIATFDVNTGVEGMNMMGMPIIVGPDEAWSLDAYADGRLVVHGSARAVGERTDTDWVVIQLDADGAPDDGFGDEGVFTLDIDQAGASARGARVVGDSIFGAGYAATMSSDGVTSPVVYKLDDEGMLDGTFGVGGIFHRVVLPTLTEAYAAAPQGTSLVTAGYGRATMEESIDILSLRLTSMGVLDETWGEDGVVRIDVNGFADRGRHLVTLPDDRVVIVGGGQMADAITDALVAVRTADGAPDTDFAATTGYRLFDLGGNNDFFWHAAVSADATTVAIVGYKAFSMQTETDNDDAVLAIWHP